MNELLTLILSSCTLGLSAGLAPGPLTTLCISQSLRFGTREGMKVALAPLVTDLPIILLTLFILARLENQNTVLAAIAWAGALFLIYLGWESLRFKGLAGQELEVKPQSWQKGIIANLLNPHPYLFWFTVGGPLLMQGEGPTYAATFLVSFYILLVGTKLTLAWLVGRWRGVLGSAGYIWTNRLLGVALLGFAVYFVWQGLDHLGWV